MTADTGYPDLAAGELDAIEREDRGKAARVALGPAPGERIAAWEAGLIMDEEREHTPADLAALEQARKEVGR